MQKNNRADYLRASSEVIQCGRDLGQILSQQRARGGAIGLTHAQDGGRVPACQRSGAAIQRAPLPAFGGLSKRVTELGLRRHRAQRQHNAWAYPQQFGGQPWPARGLFAGSGALMQPAFAARDELEMLDRVGDVGHRRIQARVGHQRAQQLAGRAHERAALLVFLVPGLFANDHQRRAGRAGAKYNLSGRLPEIAATAVLCLRSQRGQGAAGHGVHRFGQWSGGRRRDAVRRHGQRQGKRVADARARPAETP